MLRKFKHYFVFLLILVLSSCNAGHKPASSRFSYNTFSISSSSVELMDAEKVHYLEELIAALPNPSTNNEVVKAIFEAKAVYDSLFGPDQACVENYSKLENYVSQVYSFVSPNLSYTSKYEVSLYIFLYDDLPKNYITKAEAEQNGWTSGKSLWDTNPNKSIGGDRFYNNEGLLPNGTTYYECDIDYQGSRSRNSLRLVYSLQADTIYYTSDHYESFEQLY